MTIQKVYLPLIALLILVLNVGCAESGTSETFNQKLSVGSFDDDDDDGGEKDKAPMAMAYGGFLQFHYYDLSKSDENVMGVESLIGQPIMAKVHSKNGVRVDVGYPGLQAAFALE